MAKAGTLYTYCENFRALKVLIAAGYSGANVEVDPKFVFGETNRTDAFLKKFPLGKVPAFESKDGKVLLTESDAIAYYVSDDTLRGGKGEQERAQVLQWILFAQSELLPASCGWLFPSLSIMPFNKDQVGKARSETERCLKALDDFLLSRTFLVGETVTLADIAVFSALTDLYKNLLDADSKKAFVNVNRWFDTILNQPKVQGAIKKYNYNFSYCTSPVKFDAAKLKEITGGAAAGGKDKKAEEKKDKKKEEKKPQPKKEKEPEPAEEMDAAEAALAAEPKAKDPLDALPKGSFVMDDFKREYSNKDVDQSIPYFWEKFDSENYSIWFGEYKYNEELTKVFMSCNLIAGMYQRLDKLRKNAFASMCLFGEDNNSTISGIWVWRGQDLAFTLSPDWQIDYETYGWTKLDPKAPETKKMVNDYLSWEGTDKQGRKFNQGKIFK
ncbi:Elongation factor 1-gamma [Orchesella cincta]|uniref:Elongation factor 1-gamma n=1 Tax=Orchesella cincta TaxID=48709 RepID=A0A1D2M7N9_ORCCI|nr:Elongation factor 1-gamma [Orchesella cincta]